jgi:hypothetical protein
VRLYSWSAPTSYRNHQQGGRLGVSRLPAYHSDRLIGHAEDKERAFEWDTEQGMEKVRNNGLSNTFR